MTKAARAGIIIKENPTNQPPKTAKVGLIITHNKANKMTKMNKKMMDMTNS